MELRPRRKKRRLVIGLDDEADDEVEDWSSTGSESLPLDLDDDEEDEDDDEEEEEVDDENEYDCYYKRRRQMRRTVRRACPRRRAKRSLGRATQHTVMPIASTTSYSAFMNTRRKASVTSPSSSTSTPVAIAAALVSLGDGSSRWNAVELNSTSSSAVSSSVSSPLAGSSSPQCIYISEEEEEKVDDNDKLQQPQPTHKRLALSAPEPVLKTPEEPVEIADEGDREDYCEKLEVEGVEEVVAKEEVVADRETPSAPQYTEAVDVTWENGHMVLCLLDDDETSEPKEVTTSQHEGEEPPHPEIDRQHIESELENDVVEVLGDEWPEPAGEPYPAVKEEEPNVKQNPSVTSTMPTADATRGSSPVEVLQSNAALSVPAMPTTVTPPSCAIAPSTARTPIGPPRWRVSRLNEEHSAHLLLYAVKEQTSVSMLHDIASYICICCFGCPLRDCVEKRMALSVLMKRFNRVASSQLKAYKANLSEWMKIELSADDESRTFVPLTTQKLLRRPVQVTVQPIQLANNSHHKVQRHHHHLVSRKQCEPKQLHFPEHSAMNSFRSEPEKENIVANHIAHSSKKNSVKASPVHSSPARRRSRAQSALRGELSFILHQDEAGRRHAERDLMVMNHFATVDPNAVVTGNNRSMPINWELKDDMRAPARIPQMEQLTAHDLRQHIKSIRCQTEMKQFLRMGDTIKHLMDHPRNTGQMFNHPVDVIKEGIPTYYDIIKRPMDLGTIKKRLDNGEYHSFADFDADMCLVFQNAIDFNGSQHWVSQNATILLELYFKERDSIFKKMAQATSSHTCAVCMGHTCKLCRGRCIEMATPHMQCSMGCETEIRRGSYYYVLRDGTRVFCSKCQSAARRLSNLQEDHQPTALDQDLMILHKMDLNNRLIRKKCHPDPEPWVKCSKCNDWMHQVCTLFNPVDSAYSKTHDFVCAACILDEKEAKMTDEEQDQQQQPGQSVPVTTKTIPVCAMSEFIEAYLKRELGAMGEHATAQTLWVRVISSAKEKMRISDSIINAFDQNADFVMSQSPSQSPQEQSSSRCHRVPKEVPFVGRGIYLFQKHHGIDVCLFAMYTQEFGEDCVLPSNRRSLYVAYIDSVRYLQPASARTASYYMIMLAYFDFMRRQGFQKVHIWSCPPIKRISYVFWCRPPFQKTPGNQQLRQWYKVLLTKALERGIVSNWDNLINRFFLCEKNGKCRDDLSPSLSSENENIDKSNDAVKGTMQTSLRTTRGSWWRNADPEEYIWPMKEFPPVFDGDFVPAEMDRVLANIKAKNGKFKRSTSKTLFGAKSASIARKGGKIDSLIKTEPICLDQDGPEQYQVDVKLRDLFQKLKESINRLREDLLVVDLVELLDKPGEEGLSEATCNGLVKGCHPEATVPSWCHDVPRFFGSRFMFHQVCSYSGYQFDSLRRAKHSTMMLLHHFSNEQVVRVNRFCAECNLLITMVPFWKCKVCFRFALCDWCHYKQKTSSVHEHPLVYD